MAFNDWVAGGATVVLNGALVAGLLKMAVNNVNLRFSAVEKGHEELKQDFHEIKKSLGLSNGTPALFMPRTECALIDANIDDKLDAIADKEEVILRRVDGHSDRLRVLEMKSEEQAHRGER
jgi:hypothetical protein